MEGVGISVGHAAVQGEPLSPARQQIVIIFFNPLLPPPRPPYYLAFLSCHFQMRRIEKNVNSVV